MSSFPLCAIFFSEYNHGMSVFCVLSLPDAS